MRSAEVFPLSRRLRANDSINHSPGALISASLRYRPPIRRKNLARQTGTQDSVWPLSFWKEVRRQYQCEWRAPNSIVDPAVEGVNSRIVECKDPQIPKRNSLLNLVFFVSCNTERLKYHRKQPSKNDDDNRQKLTILGACCRAMTECSTRTTSVCLPGVRDREPCA